ncbi:hypothetical protein NKJ09_31125 [Mesorhizobium sp. M0189]|uniref:hypothetical protein n=1 Tax=Mesorhizobium sp. M0189 TaxID=2956909 RepID=UPI0033381ED7
MRRLTLGFGHADQQRIDRPSRAKLYRRKPRQQRQALNLIGGDDDYDQRDEHVNHADGADAADDDDADHASLMLPNYSAV